MPGSGSNTEGAKVASSMWRKLLNFWQEALINILLFMVAPVLRDKKWFWQRRHKPVPVADCPSGKLGEIVLYLESSDTVSLCDLMQLTGWQRHTMHAALSRLRSRGYIIERQDYGKGAIYQLTSPRQGGAE